MKSLSDDAMKCLKEFLSRWWPEPDLAVNETKLDIIIRAQLRYGWNDLDLPLAEFVDGFPKQSEQVFICFVSDVIDK